jgi:hypothetical protein
MSDRDICPKCGQMYSLHNQQECDGRPRDDRKIKGFMCAIDWQHELGEASGGNRIYPSLRDLKEYHPMWEECGVVEVEVSLVGWVAEQNLGFEIKKGEHG